MGRYLLSYGYIKTKGGRIMEYKTIEIPITEEDITMFQELIIDGIPFTWTFDDVNVIFVKREEE